MPTVPSSWLVWLTTPGVRVDELREVAAVQLQLVDLFAGDGGADFRGLRFHLGDAFAGYYDFFRDRADGQLHVDARFLRHVQHHSVGCVFLKALCGDDDVIGGARQPGRDVSAIAVAGVSRVRLPVVLVMTTSAPAMAAPDLSVTVPLM